MFNIDMEMVKIAFALLLLIGANILLGSTNAFMARQFDKTKFINGIIKGSVIAVSIVMVYAAGLLIPNIVIMQIDGQNVTLVMALGMLFVAAIIAYGQEDIGKIATFFKTKFGNNTNTTVVNNYHIIESDELRPVQETFTSNRTGDRGDEPPDIK